MGATAKSRKAKSEKKKLKSRYVLARLSESRNYEASTQLQLSIAVATYQKTKSRKQIAKKQNAKKQKAKSKKA